MGIEQDVKREGGAQAEDTPEAAEGSVGLSVQDAPHDVSVVQPDGESLQEQHEVAPVASPSQLGARRFVFAGYFAAAIAIAFLLPKILDFAWYRLQTWKPALGEPRDEIVMPVSALVGGLTAVYYWYRTRARQLAEEVASEMGKVTWPSRTEVTNGTFVVLVTTVVSTVFFALMDRFWGFVTNLVYGGS
jgi:preprotein translocase subunit SecE